MGDQLPPIDEVNYADLETRNVRAAPAERLMIAVANHPAIQELSLGYSKDIGHMGLDMIGRHLPNVKLRKLELRDIDNFDRKIKQAAYHHACQALVDGVRTKLYLHGLHFRLPSVYREDIDFYLQLNKIGRHQLHQSEHVLEPAEMCHLLTNCGENVAAIYYFLREQPQFILLADDDVGN